MEPADYGNQPCCIWYRTIKRLFSLLEMEMEDVNADSVEEDTENHEQSLSFLSILYLLRHE